MGSTLTGIASWNFLGEPAWRWFIFVGVMLLFLFAWHGVERHM